MYEPGGSRYAMLSAVTCTELRLYVCDHYARRPHDRENIAWKGDGIKMIVGLSVATDSTGSEDALRSRHYRGLSLLKASACAA